MKRSGAKRPLPRGPHGLSREEVERSQRERLLAAMAEAVSAKGYAHTSVADVLERAGVSRATFYAMFRDKEECFQAAFESAASTLARAMAADLANARTEDAESAGSSDPLRLLDRVLTAYLRVLQSSPALAKTFLVEVYAAGPRAVQQRRASLEAFVDILAETHRGERGLLGTEPDQRFAVEMLVHAVSSLVTQRVGAGEVGDLLSLREPLLALAESLDRVSRPGPDPSRSP